MKALQLLDNLIVKLETNLGLPHRYAAAAPPQAAVAPPPPAPEEVKVPPKQMANKKEKKAARAAKSKQNAKPAAAQEEYKDDDKQSFYNIDLRVGRFVEVWKHPESENLYCEKIDIAEDEPRQIGSGLQ